MIVADQEVFDFYRRIRLEGYTRRWDRLTTFGLFIMRVTVALPTLPREKWYRPDEKDDDNEN